MFVCVSQKGASINTASGKIIGFWIVVIVSVMLVNKRNNLQITFKKFFKEKEF